MFKYLFLFVLLIPCLVAQSVTATLVGTVTDSIGAVVSGSHVVVTNEGTGAMARTITNDVGDYVVTNLPPAVYTIRADAAGFKATEITGVRLLLNATVRVDARLAVGGTADSITVTAAAPTISSETSSVATVVDSTAVSDLPVNGRTLDRFILVSAGNTSDNSSNPNLGGSLHWGGANFTIDGIPFNDPGNGGASYSYSTSLSTTPSIDTIQEFKVEAVNAKAEYRGSVGVAIITKSGTNDFHGSLLEFNRNREFAARNFFSTASKLAEFNRNEFGGTVGGPVIRNRTFFFGSFEGSRQRTATTSTISASTAAMRTGDLSVYSTAVKDPLAGGTFAGNIIPTSRLSPVAQKLLAYSPLPNRTGLSSNYTEDVSNKLDVNRESVRIDHLQTAQDVFTASLTYSKGDPYQVAQGFPSNYGNFSNAGYITKSGSLTYTRTFSAAVINEARYSYFSHGSIRQGQNLTLDTSTLIPGLYPGRSLGGLPTINISNFTKIYDYGGAARSPETTQSLGDSITWVHGSHIIKAGGDANLVRVQINPSVGAAQLGTFSFNGQYSGLGFADFLLGDAATSARATVAPPILIRDWYYGAYVQDDWKISRRLTLNLGFRYELQTTYHEKNGLQTNFDFASGQLAIRTSGGNVPALANTKLLGLYPWVGSEKLGWGSDMMLADNNNAAPRLGFAWRPFNSSPTVVRGGYGIFYNQVPAYIGIYQLSSANIPTVLSETFEGAATTPTLTFDNPFSGSGALAANPTIYAVNRNLTNALAQEWNLTIEHDLRGNGFRVTYLGNQATRVPWYMYLSNLPQTMVAGTLQSQRPYQPWGTIYTLNTNGVSNTQQLQAEVTRRLQKGLFLNASYTWNHSLDNVTLVGSPQNPYNAQLERGNADGIRRQNFYLSGVYDLPVGPGKSFLSGNGIAGKILGGWQLGTILQVRSGTPFSVTFSSTSTAWYATRANETCSNFYPASRSISNWFNASCFTTPPAYTFGNSARNLLFGPGQFVLDANLSKSVEITERIHLQLRAEAYNMPNHPSFSAPSASVSSPSSIGHIYSTSVDPRTLSLGAKLVF